MSIIYWQVGDEVEFLSWLQRRVPGPVSRVTQWERL